MDQQQCKKELSVEALKSIDWNQCFLGHPIYEELKNLVGEDATRKIANLFNRASVYFPRPSETFPVVQASSKSKGAKR
ncbi:MAG: hypothetical protein HPY65_07955 [Syntrophaceae bacterium]|nr:hypothetical protein [Syntrophaceae bacterium]